MAKIETKFGKSRKVEIYDNYVIKNALNNDIDDEDLIFHIVMGNNGEYENIKEFFLWESIKDIPLLKSIFAEIIYFDYKDISVKSEKLIPVDEKYFYENVFTKYLKLSKYSLNCLGLLDNHTVDNNLNYGFDKEGNLKLLDYGVVSGCIFELYGLSIEDIKNHNDLKNHMNTIKNSILYKKIPKMNNLYTLLPLALTLKYYNKPFKFYYYIFKYKLLDLKTMFDMFLDKKGRAIKNSSFYFLVW